jgi:hypothetical protein
MSFYVKCTRCSAVDDACFEQKPVLPEGWGELRLLTGPDAVPWTSKYEESHLCPQCIVELGDFLRGCKIAYEDVSRRPTAHGDD